MFSKRKPSLRRLILLALYGALIFAVQTAMASIPNINATSTLIIALTLAYSWQALYAVAVYVLLEGLSFGFGIWWLSYLYIWTIPVALTVLFRKKEGRLFWALLAGLFGVTFGALCTLPYFFIDGFRAALSYWLNGISFDLLHGAGNFAVTFLLLPPLRRALAAGKGTETH